ncbi:BadF/BadG/BcrA/BcrD ATPase family protein [Streptomyces sp. NPDC048409]|uniref:BadF/BadG/BcrA/BcrD ATPase family protein n=1 Tax=Streptomyces sp. NPDC048409 TaxID=3154723 RepID=UPI003434AC32
MAAVVQEAAPPDQALFAVGAACTPSYAEEFAALLAKTLPEALRPPGRTYVTNDVVPLFFTEDHSAYQLVVIAGTGSGVTARRGFHAIARHGAHEYLLGDEGGAFDIGRRALRAAIAAAEGRGKPTRLTELVAQRTGGIEIDRFVYGSGHPKQTVADFARDAFAADLAGDPTAYAVLESSADRLADVCRGALTATDAGSLGESRPTVTATFTGSLLTEPSGRLRERLERRLRSLGVAAFRPRVVDVSLMLRTLDNLRSDPAAFAAITAAVPAVRL